MVHSFLACALFLVLIADINADTRSSESARYRDNESRRTSESVRYRDNESRRHHPSNGGMSGRRIYNGQVAKEGEFPYLGYMMVHDLMKCGVTIIHKRWLLTAGQCVTKCEIGTAMTFGSNIVGKGGQTYKPERCILHKLFHVINLDFTSRQMLCKNDIALIRLETDISFTSNIKPVKLPDDYYYQNYDGGPAMIAGWGRQDFRDPTPSILSFADVNVTSAQECRDMWYQLWGSFNHLCVKNIERKGGCFGDNGGPLVTKDGIQLGILTRFASDECRSGKNYFLNLRDYLPWIKEVLSQYSDSL